MVYVIFMERNTSGWARNRILLNFSNILITATCMISLKFLRPLNESRADIREDVVTRWRYWRVFWGIFFGAIILKQ